MLKLDSFIFSAEAEGAINELITRLRLFSKMIKKNEEPSTFAVLKEDEVLEINISVNTAKGKVNVKLDIPQDHWEYAN